MVTRVENEICIGGKRYYDSYKISSNSKGEITLIPSDNIQIDMSKSKFTFKPKTDIKTLRHDAEFCFLQWNIQKLLSVHTFPYGNPHMPKELRNDLQFFIDLDKLLTQIDFEYLIF